MEPFRSLLVEPVLDGFLFRGCEELLCSSLEDLVLEDSSYPRQQLCPLTKMAVLGALKVTEGGDDLHTSWSTWKPQRSSITEVNGH